MFAWLKSKTPEPETTPPEAPPFKPNKSWQELFAQKMRKTMQLILDADTIRKGYLMRLTWGGYVQSVGIRRSDLLKYRTTRRYTRHSADWERRSERDIVVPEVGWRRPGISNVR